MFCCRTWFALLIAAFIAFPAAAVAQSHFKVLHSFDGKGEGAKYPTNIVMDASGNLYGVATHGGYSGCGNGCGAVYELSPTGSEWTYKFVYGFKGYKSGDGSTPNGLAVDGAGNLYGTTAEGGGPYNAGTVFELTPSSSGAWTETVIHVFTFGGDTDEGYYPGAAPILDAAGNLYGTTASGGDPGCDCGTVWELSPPSGGSGPWTETILWNFTTGNNGQGPIAPLIFDGSGNLFGLTQGAAFELSPGPSGWTEKVLYQGIPGGNAGLAIDAHDNLFGTEYQNAGGWGEVYELARANGSWTYIDLWDFNPLTRPGDGAFPASPITVKNSVVLLGATEAGGNGWEGVNDCDEISLCGFGTIFALTENSSGQWAETGQFRLNGEEFGGPAGNLLLDSAGNIYGTSIEGESGYGEVFELTPLNP
jgi:uncharacterized repeat protein (TIGR03803 family)